MCDWTRSGSIRPINSNAFTARALVDTSGDCMSDRNCLKASSSAYAYARNTDLVICSKQWIIEGKVKTLIVSTKSYTTRCERFDHKNQLQDMGGRVCAVNSSHGPECSRQVTADVIRSLLILCQISAYSVSQADGACDPCGVELRNIPQSAFCKMALLCIGA